MVEIEFDKRSLNKFLKRVTYCSKFGEKNAKKMRSINRKVSKTYVKAARSKIGQSKRPVVIWKNGQKDFTVEPGRLYRSVGSWTARGHSNMIFAGPRSGVNKTVTPNSRQDGWFAAITESGYAGSEKSHNTKYKGLFTKAMNRTHKVMRAQQIAGYRREFNSYMK